MATHSELLVGLKNWLVGLIADNDGFITTQELVEAVGIPFPIVNRVLYEERSQKGAVIEVGQFEGEQAYQFIGGPADLPTLSIDKALIRDTLSGKKPSPSTTPKKKSAAKKTAGKKSTSTKTPPKKKAVAKKAVAKKAAVKKQARATTSPVTTSDEFNLDVAALVLKMPRQVNEVCDIMGASSAEVEAAARALEKDGLVGTVVMELGDEVTLTPTKKLVTNYRRKLNADDVVERYKNKPAPAPEAESSNDHGSLVKATNSGMDFNPLQVAILTAAADQELITQSDLISNAEILLPEKVDRLDISEEILNLQDEGYLDAGKSGRTTVYSLANGIDVAALGTVSDSVEQVDDNPEPGESKSETSSATPEDVAAAEADGFLERLMQTLNISSSGDEDQDKLAIIEQTEELAATVNRIRSVL